MISIQRSFASYRVADAGVSGVVDGGGLRFQSELDSLCLEDAPSKALAGLVGRRGLKGKGHIHQP